MWLSYGFTSLVNSKRRFESAGIVLDKYVEVFVWRRLFSNEIKVRMDVHDVYDNEEALLQSLDILKDLLIKLGVK